MGEKLHTEEITRLFEAVLCLKDTEECYSFFEDLCTINELQAMSQRLEVAKMLQDKKTYVEITEQTGASTTTIGRVNRALHYGKDGYKLILKKLEEI